MRKHVVNFAMWTGAVSLLVMMAVALHLTFESGSRDATELFRWVVLPAFGVIFACAVLVLCCFEQPSQWRTCYEHAKSFIVEVELPHARWLRRMLVRLWPIKAEVTITIRQEWPCGRCLQAMKAELRKLFGDNPIKLDPDSDIIKFKVDVSKRSDWLLGDDFDKMTNALCTQLNRCVQGAHYRFDLAG